MNQALLIIVASIALDGTAITKYPYDSMRDCQTAAEYANAQNGSNAVGGRAVIIKAFCLPRR